MKYLKISKDFKQLIINRFGCCLVLPPKKKYMYKYPWVSIEKMGAIFDKIYLFLHKLQPYNSQLVTA